MTRIGVGILVAVVLIVALGSCKIKTTGTPKGRSARVGDNIVTLMNRLEPYMPSLNRDHANDRYTIGLLIHSVRDTSVREFVPIVKGQRAADINLMNITGVEGHVVWYRAAEAGAYDLARKKFLANEPGWSAGSHAPAKPFSQAELNTGAQPALGMLIAGGEPSPTQWLAVLTADEATRVWSPGSSIWITMPVDRSKEPRKFYMTDTERGPDGKPRVKKLELIENQTTMFNAAFVRADRMGDILHLSSGGFLLQYETKSFNGTIVAARVDGTGKILWTVDTGISELSEVLPDPMFPAFIGAKTKEVGMVSEPLLVVVDAASGKVVTHSLWLN